MTLRRWIALIKIVVATSVIAATIAVAERTGASVFWMVPVTVGVVWFVNRRVGGLVAARAHKRFVALVEAKRGTEAQELMHQLRELYAGSVSALEQLRMNEATVYSTMGQHTHAIQILESIEPARLAPAWKPWYLNNLAWSLAHAGQAPRAVEMARESIAASEAAGDRAVMAEDLRKFQPGTLGACLVLAGDADAAITPL